MSALAGAALWLFALSGLAQEAAPEPASKPDTPASDLRMSGFGTLGVAHTEAPAGWGFRRDVSQPADSGRMRGDVDSRLGLQLNYAPTPQVELVGQALLTRRSPYAAVANTIEWAFVAVRPRPDTTLRVGRLDLDQYVMSDYRNTGFAYPWVRPPVEFYGSLPTTLDGADLTRTWNLADARWQLKAFAGRDHGGDLAQGGATQLRPLFGLMVSRQAGDLLLRAGLSHSKLQTVTPVSLPLIEGLGGLATVPVAEVASEAQALRARIDNQGYHATYATLGLDYEGPEWLATVELAHATGHPTVRFDAAYAYLGRRFGAVTAFGGISGIRSSVPVVAMPDWTASLTPVLGAAGAAQAQLLGAGAARAANLGQARQRTLSLGLRWDVDARLALKLQWDRVHVGTDGSRLWSNATEDATRADVVSLVLDFVF